MDEPAFLVIQSQNNRPEVLAAALGVGVAANYAIDRLRDFYLEPFLTAAFFVVTVALFRENTLQPFLFCQIEQGQSLREMIGVANQCVGQDNLRQSLLPLLEGDAAQIITVQIDEIENVVLHGEIAAG